MPLHLHFAYDVTKWKMNTATECGSSDKQSKRNGPLYCQKVKQQQPIITWHLKHTIEMDDDIEW